MALPQQGKRRFPPISGQPAINAQGKPGAGQGHHQGCHHQQDVGPDPFAGVRVQVSQEQIKEEKESLAKLQDFEKAAKLRDMERSLSEKLESAREKWEAEEETRTAEVDVDDVAEVVSMMTGIPTKRIAETESKKLLRMEEVLRERVVGQDDAIQAISRAVRRARAGLKDPQRPIGSFMFLGPTGVGKTELAKALAEFMFGTEEALLQLDMSEFMERHTVSRLVGAPPGYVGYEDAGQLTETERRRPFSVICFDEVEKAHPEAVNMLLQIMEDGHLSDAKGRKVDFRNAIIIMTSNIGAELISRQTSLGFAVSRDEAKTQEEAYEEMKEKLLAELKRTFRPEFLNRVDGVMVFKALTREEIKQIVDLELNKVRERLEEQQIELEVSDAAKEHLAQEGYDTNFGARPLKRVIQRLVEDPLSEGLLAGEFQEGDTVLADLEDGEVKLHVVEKVAEGNGEGVLEALLQ